MIEQKIYINAFISACISIFIPLFVWGNIIAFLPWLANKLNLLDSSLGFFFMFYAMMQIIVSQISGRLIIPKIGSKKTQALGMLIFSTHTILLGLAYNNYHFYFILRLPAGIALGLMFPTCTAITGVAEEKTKKILQPLFTCFYKYRVFIWRIKFWHFSILRISSTLCHYLFIFISSNWYYFNFLLWITN